MNWIASQIFRGLGRTLWIPSPYKSFSSIASTTVNLISHPFPFPCLQHSLSFPSSSIPIMDSPLPIQRPPVEWPLYPTVEQPSIQPVQMKNDIQNRRRKMKNHQKRKWRKKHASLIRKLELQQEDKEKYKLEELFAFWRKRSEAWDPYEKIETRLNLARRSGFSIDILKTPGSPLYKPS